MKPLNLKEISLKEEMKGYLIQRKDTFKEILSKYKEIIGGKDE